MNCLNIVPYLGLIICPSNISRHDLSFKKRFQYIFLQHDEIIQQIQPILSQIQRYGIEIRVHWVFSLELLYEICNSYPYSSSQLCPWVSDLIPDINEFVKRCEDASKIDPEDINGYLIINHENFGEIIEDPDLLLPEYCSETVLSEWTSLCCSTFDIIDSKSFLACSDTPKFNNEIQFTGMDNNNHIFCSLEIPENWRETLADNLQAQLIENDIESWVQEHLWQLFTTWSELRMSFDPWYRHNLPISGDTPFSPSNNWFPGRDFIRSREGARGFIDNIGQSWEWDDQEKHWDVQNRVRGRGRYIRVWPDGRLVDH